MGLAQFDRASGSLGTKYTIHDLCSQFRESEWHQQICGSESTLADAIMDRISYDSYKIDIESIDSSKDFSMREVYGLDPAMAK